MSKFKATFATPDWQEYEVVVDGESAETCAEFLDNCGEYEGDLLLSIETTGEEGS